MVDCPSILLERPRLARRLIAAGLILFFLMGVTLLLPEELVHARERVVTEQFSQLRQNEPAWLGATASLLSTLGSPGIPLVIVALGLYWLWRGYRHRAFLLLVSCGGAELIWLALIFLVGRPRPRPVVAFSFLQIDMPSFPSGHVFLAVVFFALLFYVYGRRVTSRAGRLAWLGVLGVLTTVTSLVRLYLGVHYLTDVLASLGLGLAWAVVAFIIADRHYCREVASS